MLELQIPHYVDTHYLNLFYVIFLFSSALYFLYLRSIWQKKVPQIFFWIHFFIVSWSALMYCNLLFNTLLKPYVWYCDWIVSTPLIMLALALTAMYPLTKINTSLIFAIMSTQAIVITTGFLAHISPSKAGLLTFFGIGNAFMFLIFYLVCVPLMNIAAENKLLLQKYRTLAILLIAFWISYPVAWIIGTPGLALVSPFITNLLFVILPILCKPVFGIVDLYLLNSLQEK